MTVLIPQATILLLQFPAYNKFLIIPHGEDSFIRSLVCIDVVKAALLVTFWLSLPSFIHPFRDFSETSAVA